MHSIKAAVFNTNNHRLDTKLEGLRGLCALNVVVAHLFGFNFFGAMHTPIYQMVMRIQFAHISVLIFFIISGYVMGISHINTNFNYSNVKSYLKKRIIRLYPIYLIALLISISFAPSSVSVPQTIGHLFFLQDFFVKLIPANVVLWSLSYEVVYYLLFIGLWALQRQNKNYYLLLSIGITCYVFITPSYTVFKSVIIGWIFWLAGLYLARSPASNDVSGTKYKFKPLISYFLLLLSVSNLDTGSLLLRLLHITPDHQKHIIYEDLCYFPICMLITAAITGRCFKYMEWIKVIAYTLPAFSVFTLLYFRHNILADTGWTFGVVYFTLATCLFRFKTDIYLFQKLLPAGKISYAIYVFHFPVAFFLDILLQHYLSGLSLLVIGLTLWIIITYSLSFYIELKLQPYIKTLMMSKNPNTSATAAL